MLCWLIGFTARRLSGCLCESLFFSSFLPCSVLIVPIIDVFHLFPCFDALILCVLDRLQLSKLLSEL